jgi:acyl-CoA synthetase (AMP-forming)/AMP-acid ligase II
MEPGRWLLEMSRNRGSFASSPNFGYALAARAALKGFDEPVDLSSWAVAASGGELIDPNTLDHFYEATAPFGFDPSAMAPGYGLAEATCVVAATARGEGVRVDVVDRSELALDRATPAGSASIGTTDIVSVGAPIPGTELRIVAEDGSILGDRQVGEIEVRGPCVMDGYVGREVLTIEDGWLRTGDRGYLSTGDLFVTGRIKDVIVIRGQNFYAEDLERVIQEAAGVRKGRCIAVGMPRGDTEALVVAAETKLTDPDELQTCRREITQLLVRETDLAPAEVRLVAPNKLPRTTSGKLQRSLFKKGLENEGVTSA